MSPFYITPLSYKLYRVGCRMSPAVYDVKQFSKRLFFVLEDEISPMDSTRLSEILGKNPQLEKSFGDELHAEIAIRWNNYLATGIKKEEITEIVGKHLIPNNCKLLKAPTLNEEVLVCLPREALKQDEYLSRIQNELGNGLAAIGAVMTKIMSNRGNIIGEDILLSLAESAQLFCNVSHSLSEHRRHLIKPHMSYESRKIVHKCPIDEQLFGQSLNESIKSNEAVKKISQTLKLKTKESYLRHTTSNDNNRPGPSGWQPPRYKNSATGSLNYQRPRNTTRKKTENSVNRRNQTKQQTWNLQRFRK